MIEFDECYVEGCTKAHGESDITSSRVIEAVKAEQLRLHMKALEMGCYLSEVCYGDLLEALPRRARTAMMESPAPAKQELADLKAQLAHAVEQGDAEQMLATMLEAERIGAAYWNGEDWEWRRAS